jgi:hypothetical protein
MIILLDDFFATIVCDISFMENLIYARSVAHSLPGNLYPSPNYLSDPMLNLDGPLIQINLPVENRGNGGHKLFLVPKPTEGSEYPDDQDTSRKPSYRSELPPLQETITRYVLGVVEIWGGRRQPMQLARLSHRSVYATLLTMAGEKREIPKIRKVYISEPIEGVAETTVTLRFNERVRSLVMRFEGADKRWLCTELALV